MTWQPGQSGNPGGKPRGAKTRLGLSTHVKRQLIKELKTRAFEQHDPVAQDTLALIVLRESA